MKKCQKVHFSGVSDLSVTFLWFSAKTTDFSDFLGFSAKTTDFSKTLGKTWDLKNSKNQWKQWCHSGVSEMCQFCTFSSEMSKLTLFSKTSLFYGQKRQKRQNWHFLKRVHKRVHKSGGFRQLGMLGPWLYPKEAWWTHPTVPRSMVRHARGTVVGCVVPG